MIRYYSVPKETFVTNGTIVEPLTATENGTYAPPAGTAYSPVVVNVEGGGGSSDFSTAEVTVVNNFTDQEISTYLPNIANDILSTTSITAEEQTEIYTVVLYKGSVKIAGTGFGRTVETSGDASYEYENDILTITGNCTVTYSVGSLPPSPSHS